MLTGVYTPNTNTIIADTSILGSPAIIINEPQAKNGPVTIVRAALTSLSGTATLLVESGTWDGMTFTPTQEIGFIVVNDHQTKSTSILHLTQAH